MHVFSLEWVIELASGLRAYFFILKTKLLDQELSEDCVEKPQKEQDVFFYQYPRADNRHYCLYADLSLYCA